MKKNTKWENFTTRALICLLIGSLMCLISTPQLLINKVGFVIILIVTIMDLVRRINNKVKNN